MTGELRSRPSPFGGGPRPDGGVRVRGVAFGDASGGAARARAVQDSYSYSLAGECHLECAHTLCPARVVLQGYFRAAGSSYHLLYCRKDELSGHELETLGIQPHCH